MAIAERHASGRPCRGHRLGGVRCFQIVDREVYDRIFSRLVNVIGHQCIGQRESRDLRNAVWAIPDADNTTLLASNTVTSLGRSPFLFRWILFLPCGLLLFLPCRACEFFLSLCSLCVCVCLLLRRFSLPSVGAPASIPAVESWGCRASAAKPRAPAASMPRHLAEFSACTLACSLARSESPAQSLVFRCPVLGRAWRFGVVVTWAALPTSLTWDSKQRPAGRPLPWQTLGFSSSCSPWLR